MAFRPVLFRREFDPPLSIGDLLVMRREGTIVTEDEAALFAVDHIEAIPAPSHGGIVINRTGAAIPGYTDDGAVSTAALPASGGAAVVVTPASLKLAKYQLAQWRVRFKFVNLPAPPVADDIDIQCSYGNAAPRWRTNALTGVWNSIAQLQDPSDQTPAPAQGNNQTAPTQLSNLYPWDAAAPYELWSYYDQSPTFSIVNNGSAGTAASQFAVVMKVRAYIYNLYPVSAADIEAGGADQARVRIAGDTVLVPPGVEPRDIAVIPVGYRAAITGRPAQ